MKKVMGFSIILVIMIIGTGIIDNRFLSSYNIKNIIRWTGLFGILSLGQLFVIITGGIDLSVGSICGFIGSIFPLMLAGIGMPVLPALLICLTLSVLIGLFHGLLVTKLKVQSFVVTFCGLFIYRGLGRFLCKDMTQGYGQGLENLKFLANGKFPSCFWSDIEKAPPFIANWSIPMPFIIMMFIAIILWFFLNKTIYGRYLLAIGRNENAAKYSGINTDRMIILAYVICSFCAGIAALLFSLDFNNCQPSSQGIFYELYAIAGVVLGGCSLNGGEGNIWGVLLGVAMVRVIYNVINILGIATQLEYTIVGIVILIGIFVDKLFNIIIEKKQLKSRLGTGCKSA